MTTNFPSGLDAFTNPSATDAMDSVTVPHATQHADLNDAVEALQAKVGVDGSAVTTSLDYKVANQGLTFIKSVTVGSSVSSVVVSDAFSATYDNYKIIVTDVTGSSNRALDLRLGSETGSNYKYVGHYQQWSSSTIVPYGPTTNTLFDSVGRSTTTGSNHTVIDLYSPYKTKATHGYSNGAGMGSSDYVVMLHLWLDTSDSYTSFTMFPSSGTFSGGTIKVYGYNNG